jgi:hypothetical protein
MSREVHVRFWESARVRFPRATQLANKHASKLGAFEGDVEIGSPPHE